MGENYVRGVMAGDRGQTIGLGVSWTLLSPLSKEDLSREDKEAAKVDPAKQIRPLAWLFLPLCPLQDMTTGTVAATPNNHKSFLFFLVFFFTAIFFKFF